MPCGERKRNISEDIIEEGVKKQRISENMEGPGQSNMHTENVHGQKQARQLY